MMFEELDRRMTPMGEISLRRRVDPSLGVEIIEASLGDEFLMSSLFTVAEIELARLALAMLDGDGLDVVVGGLGLGYTAKAVLDDDRVQSLTVIEALDEVISWHRDGLVPLGRHLTSDERCRLVHGDFFALADDQLGESLESLVPGGCHAVLVDIDHSPDRVLSPGHVRFYTADGMQSLAAQIRPGGVFGLWSDDDPDAAFITLLEEVFASTAADVVSFPNPYTGGSSTNTVYLATDPLR